MKPQRHQRRAAPLAMAPIALLGMTGVCNAQQPPPPAPPEDGGPIVIGQRNEQFESFVLERFHAAIAFLGRHTVDKRSGPSQPDTTDTEDILRPSLEIDAQGYIVHPNFIQLNLSGGLLLDNNKLNSQSQGVNDETTSLDTNYNIQALILGKSSMPATVYSRRDETNIDRLFGPSIDSTTTEHGAMLQILSDQAPTTLEYFHRITDQTSTGALNDQGVVQDSFQFHSNILLDEHQSLSLDYALDAVSQSGTGRLTQDFVRHDATAIHVFDFDADNTRTLRSRIQFFDHSGNSDRSRYTIDESLRLRHSDTLRTQWDLFYETQKSNDTTQDFLSGNINVQHRLYESLLTTANVGASTLTAGGFNTDEYYGDLNFDYTKIVPYGLFSASATFSDRQRENGPRGSTLRIFDEARTFNDPVPIIIARQNIFPGSVVITDTMGIIFYTEGIDYTLMTFPDRIEIRRVVGGAIADGQTVLIDYTVGPQPANSINTTGLGFSARYDINEGFLSGLGLYIRYFQRDSSIDSPQPTFFILDNTTDLIVGADYITGPLRLKAEYETYDSEIAPFDATRMEGQYLYPLGRGSSLSVNGSYQMLDFTALDNHIDLAIVTGTWSQQINERLHVNAQLVWRDEQNDFSGHTTGFEQRLNLNWRYRQTEVYVSGRNSSFSTRSEDRASQSIEVGFRRSF